MEGVLSYVYTWLTRYDFSDNFISRGHSKEPSILKLRCPGPEVDTQSSHLVASWFLGGVPVESCGAHCANAIQNLNKGAREWGYGHHGNLVLSTELITLISHRKEFQSWRFERYPFVSPSSPCFCFKPEHAGLILIKTKTKTKENKEKKKTGLITQFINVICLGDLAFLSLWMCTWCLLKRKGVNPSVNKPMFSNLHCSQIEQPDRHQLA